MFNFEKLIAYQETKKAVVEVYALVEKFDDPEGEVLKNQIKKSVVCVPTYIAEGMSLATTGEKIQYLDKAYCSIAKVYSLLQMAVELNFISSDDMQFVSTKLLETSKVVLGLKRKLRGDNMAVRDDFYQSKKENVESLSESNSVEEYI